MQILINKGYFGVLEMPSDTTEQIAKVARTCYQSYDRDSVENNVKLVMHLLKRGHMAMIEFLDMTVKFYDVSRGFTHEMVRHRLASYAQESTRYVDESDLQVIAPPHQDHIQWVVDFDLEQVLGPEHDSVFTLSFAEWCKLNEHMYRGLREAGWPCQDARQILPIGMANDIVVKANLREWRHIFAMRTSKAAHWEIRSIMCKLLEYVQTEIPFIFDDFQPRQKDNGEVYYVQEKFSFA